MLPPTGNFKETRYQIASTGNPILDDTQSCFNIFMHLFIDNNEEVDLNSYLPYIDIIANKYSEFKYHLIVVRNDTLLETNHLSAEENNELAMHFLMTKNSVQYSQNNNINIEQIALSKYMSNSPLRQYWKKLPKQFLEFLTRAVSIWDKGGVAFNPTILTPRSPHATYIEKVQNILKNYHCNCKKSVKERKIIKNLHSGLKKKVNNIRDIIEALDHDDEVVYGSPMESSFDSDVKHSARETTGNSKLPHYPTYSTTNDTNNYKHVHPKFKNVIKSKSVVDVKASDQQETLVMAESNINNVSMQLQHNNGTSAAGILPMFLDFLFRNKPIMDSTDNIMDKSTIVSRKRKHTPVDVNFNKNKSDGSSNNSEEKNNDRSKALILPAKSLRDPDKIIEVNNKENHDDGNQLTIDLKGNIVSSGIPCHAFLGTMFSNAIHHTQESLTDFIITELAIFCKGALSSCKGIDVILL